MCGIGGVIFLQGSNKDLLDSSQLLFEALEDRGRHASGVAYLWKDADRFGVTKGATKASNLNWRNIGNDYVQALMFHTRFTTQGSTENNKNNHPIRAHGFVTTHNGVIQNDDSLFRRYGVKRIAQVDSEVLNATLQVSGVESLSEDVMGSISLAWVDDTPSHHDHINLYTNGRNPLVIARTKCNNIVYASGLHHIQSAFEVTESINAEPHKHYQIWFNGTITSEYVSDRRNAPTIIRGSRNEHPAGSTRKKATGTVFGGMQYDPDLRVWRKWRN